MTDPTTTLNAPFSAPGATATSWDDARRMFETAELFWIAAVRTGRPHIAPAPRPLAGRCAALLDRRERAEGSQSAWQLERHPLDGLQPVGRWYGRCPRRPGSPSDRSRTLQRLAEAWTHKWDGSCNYAPGPEGFKDDGNGSVLVFSIRPDKVFAFAKGNFSHTRHEF
jgi:hypothetical protein